MPNVQKAFKAPGIWLVNTDTLFSCPSPANAEEPKKIVSVENIKMITSKRKRLSAGECLQLLVIRRGHVNTTNGLPLYHTDVDKAIAELEEGLRRKAEKKSRKEAELDEKFQVQREMCREERLVFQRWAMLRRDRLYGDEPLMPLFLKVRTAAAKCLIGKRSRDD